jgi:hypothetical protein
MNANAVEVLNLVLNASTLEEAQTINKNHGAPLRFQCDESTRKFDIYSLYFKDADLSDEYGANSLCICNECEAVVEDSNEGCECQF